MNPYDCVNQRHPTNCEEQGVRDWLRFVKERGNERWPFPVEFSTWLRFDMLRAKKMGENWSITWLGEQLYLGKLEDIGKDQYADIMARLEKRLTEIECPICKRKFIQPRTCPECTGDLDSLASAL